MRKLFGLLWQQSTHSAIVLAIIGVFAAKAAGVDLVSMTEDAGRLLGAVGAASIAAKAILPDAAPPPPPPISDAAVKGLERLGAAMEDRPQ